ncbi:M28 family metallopeptidase [Phenylobacterium aquaticum]|uniref:M28 family metallopeptidase n=1 Tax=Phenylobacterium aquaticum TaxID=1763816 RepID=UPI001F5DE92B|nr:M28 family metallopeptidase [Phenylobacterium aquaticum]MCI3132962.1 M28 family metallopeptidase [Phenylobacterium aquaticum]
MKRILLATACAWAVFAQPTFAAPGDIDPALLADHIKVLSSDAFEGRGPATPGETKTVQFMTDQFKAVGLQPGGDLKDGQRAWTQDVPLAKFDITGPISVGVKVGGQTQAWTQGEQIAIRAAETGADHVTLKDVPVVFVGYGVKAPERKWDDFKGVDLKGKIALVLVNDPDFETGQGDFGGKAMTYYGRWTYKYEEAARQGAAGFIVIHETAPAAYGWNTVKNSNTNTVFDIIRADPTKDHAPVEAWIQRDVTVDLFKAAGLDFEALKKQAQTRAFKPVTLTGVTFSADYAVKAEKIVSKNVVGVLPGTKRPNETVIYSAHWDHLGVGLPDAKGDKIYNGALDNASGSSMLIEIARQFAQAPRTDRSVVFLSVTAEEKGLLGSEYYGANPLYPLATTVGDINMDGIATNGPAHDFTTSGDAPLTLQDDLIAIGKAHGRNYSPDPRPGAGSFFRSDHFPFAKRGVPALSFGGGQDLVNGGKARGEALAKAFVTDRYHQPADEYSPDWDLTGAVQDGGLLYELGRKLANSDEWPEWKAGSEFKAERDKTAAARK